MKLIRKLNREERRIRRAFVEAGYQFDSYCWPGGYPLVYVCATGDILCADCATKAMKTERLREPGHGYIPEAYDVYYEGPDLECADCEKTIESAYGDPDTLS